MCAEVREKSNTFSRLYNEASPVNRPVVAASWAKLIRDQASVAIDASLRTQLQQLADEVNSWGAGTAHLQAYVDILNKACQPWFGSTQS